MKNKLAPIIVDFVFLIFFAIILYFNFNSDTILAKVISILAIIYFTYSILKELFSKDQSN
ncbi:hypothetical protein BU099_05025 [Staphylococcus xylosus]|nr:hypothetical protein BU099_05025 [Staphylococcus xylosus]